MIQSLYSAASGLAAQQSNIDAIANNIANVSTAGFKKTRVDFKDAMYQSFQAPGNNGTVLSGTGVIVSETQIISENGVVIDTQNPLDFALEKDGYFVLSNNNNELFYTRNGAFKISDEQDQDYLVNAQGYYVLDKDGNKIGITKNAKMISADLSGQITVDEEIMGTLGVKIFANPQGLEIAGMSNYKETEASGQPINASDIRIHQGYYEGSNVDLADEMTRLIRAQKAFSFISRIVSTADQMEGMSNNLRT